jgi:O-antigen/teichoic acid export membrane protein
VVARAKLTIAIDFKSQAIANTIATLLSSSLALLVVQQGYGYWALVWLMVSKALISSVCIWWFCKWLPRICFSNESFRSLFGFGSNLMFAGFVAAIVNNLYVALIGRYFNATQVGFYTQATNISNYLSQFISSSLQGVTYPIMTSIKEDRARLISIYKQLISITMLISLPMLVGFAAISKDLVPLFLGEKWLPMVPVLVALSIARTITPISAINMNILNAIGRSDLFLKIDLVKLPLTLGALFVALPYGIEGVAWATVCISFIAFFINAWYPGKMFCFGWLDQIQIGLSYLIVAMIMLIAINYVDLHTAYYTIIGKISLGALIYISILYIMKDYFIHNGWKIIVKYFKSKIT